MNNNIVVSWINFWIYSKHLGKFSEHNKTMNFIYSQYTYCKMRAMFPGTKSQTIVLERLLIETVWLCCGKGL
jgi:hypothetical protein